MSNWAVPTIPNAEMPDLDLIFFNVGAFICGCFVLEYGADRFIDHTVILAKRLRLDQTLIALLTAGAEWEELAVVIAAVAQHKPTLALGNIIGSCISNILGAFSLGLLFRPFSQFDRSARIYSLVQLIITICVVISLATAGPERMGKAGGGVLVAVFFIYIVSIAWCIYGGIVKPPEADQSDSDEDSDTESTARQPRQVSMTPVPGPHLTTVPSSNLPTEPNANVDDSSAMSVSDTPGTGRPRRLSFHIAQIGIGFLALSLSGYILSHSASSIASLLGISDTIVGLTVLSFATTLPEKFVSVLSGARGHSGILVAATAGSNIFLLTLCLGVALLGADSPQSSQDLKLGEVLFLCASAGTFATVIWLGTKRWIGALMLGGYVTFIVLEFTIWRR